MKLVESLRDFAGGPEIFDDAKKFKRFDEFLC